MSATRVSRRIEAPPSRVYAALTDAGDVARWKFPEGMAIEVHAFEGREGGRFRVSLTYENPDQRGKTTARTDTYGGRFQELVPDRRVVEVIEFETSDAAMRGEMRVTVDLVEVDGATQLTALHEGVPPGVSPADNEVGWAMSLERLARLVEARRPRSPR